MLEKYFHMSAELLGKIATAVFDVSNISLKSNGGSSCRLILVLCNLCYEFSVQILGAECIVYAKECSEEHRVQGYIFVLLA